MALTAKKLGVITQLTATAATLYTVPAATTTRVMELLICNTDTVERTITVHFVTSGGTASAANRVLSAMVVPGGGTVALGLNTVLATGDQIAALASVGAAINLLCSGTELT